MFEKFMIYYAVSLKKNIILINLTTNNEYLCYLLLKDKEYKNNR